MKKLIGYIGSHSCFWIGDLFSRLAYKFQSGFFYNGYQNFMHYSGLIQDWAKLDSPWERNKNPDNP